MNSKLQQAILDYSDDKIGLVELLRQADRLEREQDELVLALELMCKDLAITDTDFGCWRHRAFKQIQSDKINSGKVC